MARGKSAAHVGTSKEIRNDLRRSPRFEKLNDVSEWPDSFKNPNLSVSRRSPRIGKLSPDPKTPYLESVARLSSRDRSFISPPSCASVMVNEGGDEVRQNEVVRNSFVSELRRSPRFGKSCVEQIIGPNSGASVKGGQENTGKERVCLRRSPRFSNQQRNYKDAEQKLDSIVDEICGIDGGKSDRSKKKIIRKSNSPIGSGVESPQTGEETSWKNKRKGAEAGRRKRKQAKEGNEVVLGWTKEHEIALEWAYMAMKPTPHFWKTVAKMVTPFFLGQIICLHVSVL